MDPGGGLPVGACSCVCWPGSSSQAEQACRGLGLWKSQRGSGKVVTPEDLQLDPTPSTPPRGGRGGCWVRKGGAGLTVRVMSNKTCDTRRRRQRDGRAGATLNLI